MAEHVVGPDRVAGAELRPLQGRRHGRRSWRSIKTNPDEAARKEAAEEVNRIFGEQVYNLWSTWALWAVIEGPYVNGLESNVLPDSGEQGVGLAFSGRHQMNQIWCNEGVCE